MYSVPQKQTSSSSSGSGGGPLGGSGDGRKKFSPARNAGLLHRYKLPWDMSQIMFATVRFWCTIANKWRIGQVTGVTKDNDVEITVINASEVPMYTIYEAEWLDVARWLVDPRTGRSIVTNVFDLNNGGPRETLRQYALSHLFHNPKGLADYSVYREMESIFPCGRTYFPSLHANHSGV